MLDFYLSTTAGVYGIATPGDRLVEHLERTSYPGLSFPDRDGALDWLFAESDCLLACIQQCATGPTLRRSADLLMAAVDLAESGANDRRYEAVARAVTEAAKAAHDVLAEGRARTFLALVHCMTGRFQEAEDQARLALAAGAEADDALVLSRVPNQRGIIAQYEHRYADAQAHLRQAVEAFREDANRSGEAMALSNLSRVHLALDDTGSAVELAHRGERLLASLGPTFRLANAKYTVGIALTKAGRFDEALVQLTDALGAFRTNRQRLWEGMAHFRIAETHLAAGRSGHAAEHAEEALALRGLGGEWRRGMMLTILGRALMGICQSVRAEACWREALSIYATYDKLGSPEAAEVRSLLSAAAAS
jgi:tetratricopeptide (TPR) repeat protein